MPELPGITVVSFAPAPGRRPLPQRSASASASCSSSGNGMQIAATAFADYFERQRIIALCRASARSIWAASDPLPARDPTPSSPVCHSSGTFEGSQGSTSNLESVRYRNDLKSELLTQW